MSNYRFTLEKYSGQNSRYTCPKCKMKKEFTRYIDTESNQYIAEYVGRCNRLDNCEYHFPPREYFNNSNVKYKPVPPRTIKQPKTPTYFFDKILVDGSLHCDDNVSNLFIFLASIFPKEKVFNTLNKYC